VSLDRKERAMSTLTCECARCGEVLHIPVESLLVAVNAGPTGGDRLAYICSACNAFVDEALTWRRLSVLLSASCTPLLVSTTGERE
jgi:hypothetical protein